jgi:hypothetical protein
MRDCVQALSWGGEKGQSLDAYLCPRYHRLVSFGRVKSLPSWPRPPGLRKPWKKNNDLNKQRKKTKTLFTQWVWLESTFLSCVYVTGSATSTHRSTEAGYFSKGHSIIDKSLLNKVLKIWDRDREVGMARVWGSNPRKDGIFRTHPDRFWGPLRLL